MRGKKKINSGIASVELVDEDGEKVSEDMLGTSPQQGLQSLLDPSTLSTSKMLLKVLTSFRYLHI